MVTNFPHPYNISFGAANRHTIDSCEASIAMLKREKMRSMLLMKLCRECSDDSEDEEGVQIETATLGKRKRLG